VINLQDLRNYIRMQLDMDDEELPNAMLDSYIAEGYTRMMSMENRWPSFESRWTAYKTAGTPDVPLSPDCDPAGIFSVIDGDNGMRLVQVANEQAEDNFTQIATTTTPVYYTLWGGVLRLWPDPDAAREIRIRGYRYPSNWMLGGAGAEVDADSRLHILLAHYAIALSYAQQEDEVLEDVYMKRFQAGFMAARNAICNPRHNRPMIYAGGLPLGGLGHQSVTWATPPVHL
jgi:hypothetical protein